MRNYWLDFILDNFFCFPLDLLLNMYVDIDTLDDFVNFGNDCCNWLNFSFSLEQIKPLVSV